MKIDVLHPDRWSELRRAYEECGADETLPLPKPERAVMLAAFEGDRIIGCVGAERAWNVSPIWVDAAFRGNGLPLQLTREIEKFNTEGLPELLVTTNKHVELLVYKIGFIPSAGTLWRRKQ